MKLAYVTLQGRGRTDALIAEVAALLAADGVRLAGTVQSNHERPDRRKCDMDLRVLPDGPIVRISEDRGDLARGCILDSGALEQTVVAVQQRLDGAEVMIVNKFGKREAEGKGLVPVIADALERGMPVLIGVNGLNLAAFLAFAGEEVSALPSDKKAIADWCKAMMTGPLNVSACLGVQTSESVSSTSRWAHRNSGVSADGQECSSRQRAQH